MLNAFNIFSYMFIKDRLPSVFQAMLQAFLNNYNDFPNTGYTLLKSITNAGLRTYMKETSILLFAESKGINIVQRKCIKHQHKLLNFTAWFFDGHLLLYTLYSVFRKCLRRQIFIIMSGPWFNISTYRILLMISQRNITNPG